MPTLRDDEIQTLSSDGEALKPRAHADADDTDADDTDSTDSDSSDADSDSTDADADDTDSA